MATQTGVAMSDATIKVATDLFWAVLPSASLLVDCTTLSEGQIKRGLRDLRNKGLVETHEMGALLPAVPVISWTEKGLDYFEATRWERSWFGADGLGNLALYDFAKVEAVKAVAPFYATGGWVPWQIQFFERQPMIAAVEYHHPDHHVPAYLVFCWVSMLENQREVCERLAALKEAMQAQSMNPGETFWPAGIALLAASEWGAAQALCLGRAVLGSWVEPGGVAGWYYGSGSWHASDAVSAVTGAAPEGMPSLLDPIDSLRPSLSTRKLGRRKLENILTRSLWAGRGGHKLVELLTLVAIAPCGSVAHYQDLMGEKPGGTDTKKRLRRLEKMGLIEVVTKHGRTKRSRRWPTDIPVTLSEHRQGGHRYAATLAGRVQFCYVHGGRPEDVYRKTKLGRLKTLVREKVLLHLLTLSWIVHILYAPGVSPVDLSDLDKLDRKWGKLRQAALVHLLTLSSVVHINQAPGRAPADGSSLAGLTRIWTQLREDLVEDRWLYQHEDFVYEIFGQLREKGCVFAPGWQGSTTLADGQRIDPDGMVLVTTPWGRWWCYLEVELSDRTYKAVLTRCKKYGSPHRMDNLPVLIVCRDDKAEGNFHLAAAGSGLPPRMLTTTLNRLKEGGFFGSGVWSDYGKRVTLAPCPSNRNDVGIKSPILN